MNYILLQLGPASVWEKLLFGEEDSNFLLEVALRSSIMFIVILISLRVLGKRGVTQLSVFELIVILSLGSAAGDASLYKDVGLLPASLVFATIVLLYKIIIRIIGKSKSVEIFLEGKPVYLIKDGKFSIKDFDKEDLAYDEFFSEMRLKGVSHLGQVDKAIIETNGQISLFFYPDEEVKFGLPILPNDFNQQFAKINREDIYSCIYCGNTKSLTPGVHRCEICGNDCWVKSKIDKRVV